MASYLSTATQKSQADLQRLAQMSVQREQMIEAAIRQKELEDAKKAATGVALGGIGTGVTLYQNGPAIAAIPSNISTAANVASDYGVGTGAKYAFGKDPAFALYDESPNLAMYSKDTANQSLLTAEDLAAADAEAANTGMYGAVAGNGPTVVANAPTAVGTAASTQSLTALPDTITAGKTASGAEMAGLYGGNTANTAGTIGPTIEAADAASNASSVAGEASGMSAGQVAGPAIAAAASGYSLATSAKARRMPGNYMQLVGAGLAFTPAAPIGWGLMATGTVSNLLGWEI